MYQCAVRERENWCPFVWWCHENDVPRLGSWRLSSFDLLGRADQPTTTIPMPFMLRPPKWQAKQTCQIPIRGTTMNFSQARPRILEGYLKLIHLCEKMFNCSNFRGRFFFLFQILWPSHNILNFNGKGFDCFSHQIKLGKTVVLPVFHLWWHPCQ